MLIEPIKIASQSVG